MVLATTILCHRGLVDVAWIRAWVGANRASWRSPSWPLPGAVPGAGFFAAYKEAASPTPSNSM